MLCWNEVFIYATEEPCLVLCCYSLCYTFATTPHQMSCPFFICGTFRAGGFSVVCRRETPSAFMVDLHMVWEALEKDNSLFLLWIVANPHSVRLCQCWLHFSWHWPHLIVNTWGGKVLCKYKKILSSYSKIFDFVIQYSDLKKTPNPIQM